jgi:hypothetical protein
MTGHVSTCTVRVLCKIWLGTVYTCTVHVLYKIPCKLLWHLYGYNVRVCLLAWSPGLNKDHSGGWSTVASPVPLSRLLSNLPQICDASTIVDYFTGFYGSVSLRTMLVPVGAPNKV